MNPKEKSQVIDRAKESKKIDPDAIAKEMGPVMSMMMRSGPLPPEILSKVTEGHISKALEISEKTIDSDSVEKKSERKYFFWSFVILLVAIVGIIIFLKNAPELLKDIISILASLIGGFGAGYGYCKFKNNF